MVLVTQVSDFGLARESADNNYYVSKGGALPVRWTAPEVSRIEKKKKEWCVRL
jgi:hypothetical protein